MSQLVNQPSAEPTEKVKAVGIAGSVVTLVLLLGSMLGMNLPVDTVNTAAVGVAALVTIITYIVGYYKKNKATNV